MFKKKKDHLYQLLKLNNQQSSILFSFLDHPSILNLSLCSTKYYLLLNPVLINLKFNQQDKNTEIKKANKKKKNKNTQDSKTISQNQQKQIDVQVTRIPFHKAIPAIKGHPWKKIDNLPYPNGYLQKKMDSGVHFFYQEENTNKILFINRSLVDPKLNYEMGGFNSDLETDAKADLYSQMFEGDLTQLDFTSQQALLSRQKQILQKIEQKKDQINKMNEISYQEELQKACEFKKIAIILCFGGSFSFGIYQGAKCILHKSDKKYVCRKKAGERQLNRDKQSGSQIKSMGSQIRRDQEKKHIANVYQILTDNKQAIQSCNLVFLQAPGLNRLFIINDSETLSGVKNRLRSVCITAKKANFTEVQALATEISKVSFVQMK